MCELKMNWFRKKLKNCFNPQVLLPPQRFPVAAVLGDEMLPIWEGEMKA